MPALAGKRATETFEYDDEVGSEVEPLPLPDRDSFAGEPPRLILWSVVMMGALGVEQVSVYSDAHGNVFPIASPLPEYHPASPDFHIEHDAALTLTITERADALGVPPADVRRLCSHGRGAG